MEEGELIVKESHIKFIEDYDISINTITVLDDRFFDMFTIEGVITSYYGRYTKDQWIALVKASIGDNYETFRKKVFIS